MKTLEDAKKLAETMEKIGKLSNRETIAVITDMNEPLGKTVGNTLEVIESIEALNGKIEKDVEEVVLLLGSNMMKLAGLGENIEENKNRIKENIRNGKALEKFRELVINQGGDISYIDNIEKFPKAKYIIPLVAEKNGVIESLDAEKVGKISVFLGAGRIKKEDTIQKEVGLVFEKKVGDNVNIGDILAYIHGNNEEKTKEAVEELKNIYELR